MNHSFNGCSKDENYREQMKRNWIGIGIEFGKAEKRAAWYQSVEKTQSDFERRTSQS